MRMPALRATGLCIALLAVSTAARAQVAPTKPYLMAFHACEGALCSDFRNHSVYLAESADGASWSLVPGWTPFAGSVPDVIQRGRTLYFYTSPSMVARYNLDTGTSDLVPVAVHGLPSGGVSDWVDASLYIDEEGRLVLFLMYSAPPPRDRPTDPASCPSDVTSCTKEFLSATEVPDSDGTEFVVDPGARVTATISPLTSPRTAADPDIFFDGTQYVLYISHGPSTSVWTSPTLRGTYIQSTTLPGGLLSNGRGGVPAGHFDAATSRYWTYTHLGQMAGTVIRRAVHATLTEPLNDAAWQPVMTGQSLGLGSHISVESPSFAVLRPGSPAVPGRAPAVTCAFLIAPGPVTAAVVGHEVTLVWGGAGGASGYLVEIGSAPGTGNVATRQTASTETSIRVRNVPSGRHYLRIRARNACGDTTLSPEIVATVP